MRFGVIAVLAASLAIAGCGSAAPVVEEPSDSAGIAAATRVGFVGYDRLRVEVQEDYFGDDEPFVAVLRIRSTTGVPNSTRWEWVTDEPKETSGVDEGKTVDIPDASGDAWFEGALQVRPLDETQLVGMDTYLTADLMVSVAFIFEGDSGSIANDLRILKGVTDPVVGSVSRIVEGARIPFSVKAVTDPGQMTAALDELVKTAKKVQIPGIGLNTILDVIGRFVGSGGDPNDVIGVATTAFVPVSQDMLDLLQRLGIGPKTLGLLGAGEGDGNQAWTQYATWREDFQIPYTGRLGEGYLAGEVWFGFITASWVDDWMFVESDLPWQGRVKYWLRLTAAMR